MFDTNIIERLTHKDLFGSQTGLAKALGCAPHTICEKQSKSRPLTYDQMCLVLALAWERGLPITPNDFFLELLADKPKRRRAA